MMTANQFSLKHQRRDFSYTDACQMAQHVLAQWAARTVCVHLDEAEEATTGALAKLVILRRALLERKRELHVAGLRGRVLALYEMSKLHQLLPVSGGATDQSLALNSCPDGEFGGAEWQDPTSSADLGECGRYFGHQAVATA